MVRSPRAGVSNHAAPLLPLILRDARSRAPQDEVSEKCGLYEEAGTPFPSARPRSRPAPWGPRWSRACVHASPSAIFLMVPRRILPERVFGNRATVIASLNAATGPSFRAPAPPSPSRSRLAARHAGLQHHEAARHLALEGILDAEHRAFGDIGMRGEHLLHAAGGKPVPGDVDDVVGAAHHIHIAVCRRCSRRRRFCSSREIR